MGKVIQAWLLFLILLAAVLLDSQASLPLLVALSATFVLHKALEVVRAHLAAKQSAAQHKDDIERINNDLKDLRIRLNNLATRGVGRS